MKKYGLFTIDGNDYEIFKGFGNYETEDLAMNKANSLTVENCTCYDSCECFDDDEDGSESYCNCDCDCSCWGRVVEVAEDVVEYDEYEEQFYTSKELHERELSILEFRIERKEDLKARLEKRLFDLDNELAENLEELRELLQS